MNVKPSKGSRASNYMHNYEISCLISFIAIYISKGDSREVQMLSFSAISVLLLEWLDGHYHRVMENGKGHKISAVVNISPTDPLP